MVWWGTLHTLVLFLGPFHTLSSQTSSTALQMTAFCVQDPPFSAQTPNEQPLSDTERTKLPITAVFGEIRDLHPGLAEVQKRGKSVVDRDPVFMEKTYPGGVEESPSPPSRVNFSESRYEKTLDSFPY